MSRPSSIDLVSGLADIVGSGQVSTTAPDRVAYSSDQMPRHQIWKQAGDIERHRPDAVCWPATEDEVARVLAFCNEGGVPVVPFGGGSGVCGGTVPIHGGVVIDVKRMARLTAIDTESEIIDVQAGMNGQHLEDALNARGLTLGHFPSSIMCSTVGGWLAARSAGQCSSRYGKIEDMVLSCRVAFPDGSVLDTRERAPGDPDWTQLIVGSEGTLGIITSARLKVNPKAEEHRLRGFRFRSVDAGLSAMRAIMQAGLRPMALRLYDPFDSLMALGKTGPKAKHRNRNLLSPLVRALSGGELETAARTRFGPMIHRAKQRALAAALGQPALVNRVAHSLPSPCLLIIGFEGTSDVARRDMWRARQILAELGANDAGTGPGERWYKKRHAVSFKASAFFQAGAFVDTMEVATTWARLGSLYDAVRAALEPRAFMMAHFSHAYREGCSIYFTFAAARRTPERAVAHHKELWAAALAATEAVGATASHHHGVGLLKMDSMPAEHGEMLGVQWALKAALDPKGIMNPGKLFPEPVSGDAS